MKSGWLWRVVAAACAVWALYAPLELTRVILLYRVEWPGAAPFGMPQLFDAELAFIWTPLAIGALAIFMCIRLACGKQSPRGG